MEYLRGKKRMANVSTGLENRFRGRERARVPGSLHLPRKNPAEMIAI